MNLDDATKCMQDWQSKRACFHDDGYGFVYSAAMTSTDGQDFNITIFAMGTAHASYRDADYFHQEKGRYLSQLRSQLQSPPRRAG